ncbi:MULTISPECIES: hypothetical protein [unclassified Phyllobacterium]|uniref:hypothetical protein n=1 Tax=unclassified Phyllobacterium TaxID=2638441 RepID=UPI003012DB26
MRVANTLHHGRFLECLKALESSDGLTRQQLADRLSLHPVSIGLLLRRLIDEELVVGRVIHSGKTRGRPVTTFFINPAGSDSSAAKQEALQRGGSARCLIIGA